MSRVVDTYPWLFWSKAVFFYLPITIGFSPPPAASFNKKCARYAFFGFFFYTYTALIPQLEICLEALEKIDPSRPCWGCSLKIFGKRSSQHVTVSYLPGLPNTSCLTTYNFVKPTASVQALHSLVWLFLAQYMSGYWNVLILGFWYVRCLVYILRLWCSSSFRECILPDSCLRCIRLIFGNSNISVLVAKTDCMNLPRFAIGIKLLSNNARTLAFGLSFLYLMTWTFSETVKSFLLR